MNDWADEEAGLEAVQRVLDSLDDIHALQDEYVDEDVLSDMLCDNRLCALLQVIEKILLKSKIVITLHYVTQKIIHCQFDWK